MLWFYGAVLALSGIMVYIELGLTIPQYFIHGKWLPTPRSGGELNYVWSLSRAFTKCWTSVLNSLAQLHYQKARFFCDVLLRYIIYCHRKQRGKLCCLRTEYHPSGRRNPHIRESMRRRYRSEHIMLFIAQHIAPMGNMDQQLSWDC